MYQENASGDIYLDSHCKVCYNGGMTQPLDNTTVPVAAPSAPKTKFIIETPSARSGNCLLGSGDTEKEAWEDAYGPKPWTSYVKKCARGAWSREVTPEELEEIRADRANA